MERKSQIYLTTIIMYAISGFSGYIHKTTNYWFVFILSVLVALLTLSNIVFEEKEFKRSVRVELVGVCSFLAIQTLLTVAIEMVKLPYFGWFLTVVYLVQLLGLLLTIAAIVKYTLYSTKIHVTIKEAINSRKTKGAKIQTVEVTHQDTIAKQVEEVIQEETVIETLESSQQETVYDFAEDEEKEPEVIGIEFKEESIMETPYMEEEM